MKMEFQNSGRCRAGGRYSEVVVSSGLTVFLPDKLFGTLDLD